MSKIPKEILGKLEIYSQRLGLPMAQLEKELIEKYKIAKEEHPKSKKHWERAHKKLRGRLRREVGSLTARGAMFKGYFFGERLLDWIEIRKNKAKSIFKTDRERALREHLCNEEGIPLDSREFLYVFGNKEPNENYLLPYPEEEHDYRRFVYGVGSPFLEEDYKFLRLSLFREHALEPGYILFKKQMFRATIKDSRNIYELTTSGTNFLETEMIDIEKLLTKKNGKKYLAGRVVHPLKNIEKLYEIYGRDEKEPLLIEAEVPQINPIPNQETRNRLVYLDSEDLDVLTEAGVRCFIQKDFPITFKRDDTVIVCCSLSEMSNTGELIVNAFGFLPLRE